MTLQEILRAKGMVDADIEGVIGDMKTNKIFTTSHENMDVRYPKLKGDFDNLTAQHGEATTLLEQLRAEATNNEVIQARITEYEGQIAKLKEQLTAQQIDSAMDRMLTDAGAKSEDLDYLKFQWRKNGDISLDDHGKIKGGDDAISGLKTQRPAHFTDSSNQRELQPHKLPDRRDNGNVVTADEFKKMGYDARVKLKEENPELYTQLVKG